MIQRLSIELTNRCNKGCSFCYNRSNNQGGTTWLPDELVSFVVDCAHNGIQAVSFGGGEPLQYESLGYVLSSLNGTLFRSVTTNGLLLTNQRIEELAEVSPDKVHVSIHFPEHDCEVQRVVNLVSVLNSTGIRSGVNLLVARSKLESAVMAARHLRDNGIDNNRIVYLPMRHFDTPTAEELFRVAGNQPFQSMSCLTHCHASPRFCSIGWDKSVAFCSYTSTRNHLSALTFAGLVKAMEGLGLTYCGGSNEKS
jgi:MoaA/NifB/PqqE/SkfB family radical SAM enzyme